MYPVGVSHCYTTTYAAFHSSVRETVERRWGPWEKRDLVWKACPKQYSTIYCISNLNARKTMNHRWNNTDKYFYLPNIFLSLFCYLRSMIRKLSYSWIECIPGEMEMVIRSGKKFTSSESWCMCFGDGQRRLNLSSVITGGTGLNAIARILKRQSRTNIEKKDDILSLHYII